jgi:hypothetical protein
VVYKYVCEPCRQALGLRAARPYLNRIRREATSRSAPEIVRRDSTGKPWLVGTQHAHVFEVEPAGCVCACASNRHNPHLCTGEERFKIGGRPGSGFVDQLARELGREPIPEQLVSRHEDCQALVVAILAWWFSSSDDEKPAREAELETWRYEDLIKLLRDVLAEQRPDLIAVQPYRQFKAYLKKLVQFRNKIAHSRPLRGDFFNRVKREKGADVLIRITPEELAEHLDLSMALQSQLSFLPLYLSTENLETQAAQGNAA